MFENEFAKIEYIEKDNVVFHVWKKECHFEDYRKPIMESLRLLCEHKGSIFIADARNGFEDAKEDVEWGFSYFLSALKKTGCKVWGFILPEISEIEGEIDLWTKEIQKNFKVIRATSYEEILRKTNKQINRKDNMIKVADMTDLENVTKIVMKYRKFYGVENQNENEVKDFLKERIKNNQSKIFLAFDDSCVVGFIQLYPSYSTVSLKPQWILNDFYVDENFRKQGYGRKLMAYVKEYFTNKAKGFILVTDKTNETAKKFYEVNGWKTGEYDFYTFFYG